MAERDGRGARQRRKLGNSLSSAEARRGLLVRSTRDLGKDGVNAAGRGEPSPVATTVTHT